MTYLLGECSYRHAEEEEEIERGSSDYPDPPPYQVLWRQIHSDVRGHPPHAPALQGPT